MKFLGWLFSISSRHYRDIRRYEKGGMGARIFSIIISLLFIGAALGVEYLFITSIFTAGSLGGGLAKFFALILIGALITHLSAKQGYVHLRMGDTVYTYYVVKSKGEAKETNLPFSLELTSFNIKYHSGTDTPADYKSEFVITDNNVEKHVSVSMNNICSYRSYRIYQSSFDPDMRGSILAINYDPAGIPITYAGYFLL